MKRADCQHVYLDPQTCACVCVCERLASALQNHCETALHCRLLASLKLHRSVSTVEVTKNRVSSYTHTQTHTRNHKLSVAAIHMHTDSFSLCLTHTHHMRNSSAKCLTPINTSTHTHTLFPTIRALVLNN